MDQKLLKQAWFRGSFWTGMSYSLKDSVYGCVKITHVGPSLLFENSCYENFKTNFCSSFLGGMKSAMMEKPGIMVNGQHQQ